MTSPKECTQCGACLNECPVFRLKKSEEFSPKAKQHIIAKGWADDGTVDWARMMELAGQCVCCERCLRACARRLSVPEALSAARARHPQWQQYFWREWVDKGGFLWSVASRMAPLLPKAALPKKLGILHASALSMRAPDEQPAWFRLAPSPNTEVVGRRYMIFGGCTATRLRPDWMQKTQKSIDALGGMLCSGDAFTCCGGTYEHAGMLDSARKAAKANIDAWKKQNMPYIVVFCASCLHSLLHYTAMGVMTEAEARRWKECITPLSSLLSTAKVETTPDAPGVWAYHSPCHWGANDGDLVWLKKVLPGMRKGTSTCCGFGGVLKMLNPELSENLAKVCWDGLVAAQTHTTPVITGCSGCVMQLTAHAPGEAKACHWLDVWQPG